MKQQNPTYPLRMPKSLKSEAARCLLKQAGGLEPEPQDRLDEALGPAPDPGDAPRP